ncbi:MAG: ImmA/IrrE family metallo-endopeptidase [Gemmataceae bacterium]
MSVPLWAWELAQKFWMQTVPRDDLFQAINHSPFDLAILERPRLCLSHVRDYLRRASIPVPPTIDDRPLRACLVARGNGGLIFLDSEDPLEERRFSLAHELAHFLRHEWQRSQRRGALDDLTSLGDRLLGILRGLECDSFAHMLARFPDGIPPAVARLEAEADTLAVELLAPEQEVRQLSYDATSAQKVYRDLFGLPEGIAARQAKWLFPGPAESPLTDRLRQLLRTSRTSDLSRET